MGFRNMTLQWARDLGVLRPQKSEKEAIVTRDSNKQSNNFDLLRLLAALQVAIYHGTGILQLPHETGLRSVLWLVLSWFPGVPIFFCISGFLISQSVERNRTRWAAYCEARFLRIYPALWSVTCLGTLMLLWLGFFEGVALWKSGTWFLSTMTLGSTINPEFLRSFGSGTWNGSLWTISVEVSFYVFLPAIVFIFGNRKRFCDWALGLGLAASFALFVAFDGLHFGETSSVGVASKVVWFSLAGNLWMFLFGTLANRNYTAISSCIRGRFLIWLVLLVGLSCMSDIDWPQAMKVIRLFASRFVLAGLTLSAAFSVPGISHRVLRGQDISYGLYLYHAPPLQPLSSLPP